MYLLKNYFPGKIERQGTIEAYTYTYENVGYHAVIRFERCHYLKLALHVSYLHVTG